MKFQAKLLLVISCAVILSMGLIFVLMGLKIQSSVQEFNEHSKLMTESHMKDRATMMIYADAFALESVFRSMFLRQEMLLLEIKEKNLLKTSPGQSDLLTFVERFLSLPGTGSAGFSETNPELKSVLLFRADELTGRQFLFSDQKQEKRIPVPEELGVFSTTQVRSSGAILFPKKNPGTLWVAFCCTEDSPHSVVAFQISIEQLLKKIDTTPGDSYSMLVHGQKLIGFYEETSTNQRIGSSMKNGMVHLAARLVPLQNNSRIAEEEMFENPLGTRIHRWEAAATTLQVRTVPSRILRVVKAIPYPSFAEEDAVGVGIPRTDRILVVLFFIILAALLIFFLPLILVVRMLSGSLKAILEFTSGAVKGEDSIETPNADGCLEFQELTGSVSHLRDKIGGIQIRLKKSHEREALARRDAEASNRIKSVLLKEMILEIKEPLNLISGFSGLLIRKFKHQNDGEMVLRKIYGETLELNRMISSMSELSSLDLSETEPAYTEFELGRVIAKLSDNCVQLSAERHVQLELHCADIPEKIVSDKAIFFSILQIAVQTLLLFAPPKSKVKCQCIDQENSILFRISDEKSDTVPSIASVFREHENLSDGVLCPPGYGIAILNLTVLQIKAKLLGAVLKVTSSDFANTVIEILFTKNNMSDFYDTEKELSGEQWKKDENSRTRVSLSVSQPSKPRKLYLSGGREPEVLVAERSPSCVTMLSMMLENEKCRVTSAASAEECLELLRQKHFDVLLLDLNLQNAFCTALLETIRTELPASLVIVAISSGVTEAEEAALRDSGVDRWLIKPIRIEDLANVIRDLLEP